MVCVRTSSVGGVGRTTEYGVLTVPCGERAKSGSTVGSAAPRVLRLMRLKVEGRLAAPWVEALARPSRVVQHPLRFGIVTRDLSSKRPRLPRRWMPRRWDGRRRA
eukprot:scaffold2130_cov402-Prasinococcus_capsulatus_cf.AAC.8